MPRRISRGRPGVHVSHYRGRGHATALVAALRTSSSPRQAQLFLTTDVANPTSNAIYARIGFVPETDEVHLDFVDARG